MGLDAISGLIEEEEILRSERLGAAGSIESPAARLTIAAFVHSLGSSRQSSSVLQSMFLDLA